MPALSDVTVLILDDNPLVLKLGRALLEREGCTVLTASSWIEFNHVLASNTPDIIFLDVNLPSIKGNRLSEVLKSQSNKKDIPIILVSVQSSDIHRIIGLESGADDFVSKPFNPAELLARVNAVLRRARPNAKKSDNIIDDGIFFMDTDTRKVTLRRTPLKLTPKEFTLLALFIKEKGNVLSRDVISTQIWERENLETSRTIDVHVGRLRKKLGKNASLIETVGKVGYRYIPSE